MGKHFITYDLAVKLKKLGFDEECFGFYDNKNKNLILLHTSKDKNSILAPLFQQVFDWFREKHNLHCVVDEYENPTSWGYLINNEELDEEYNFETYEEARQACLEKLIELSKKN